MPSYRSAHDHIHLLRRWRRIAKTCGLSLQTIHTSADLPVIALRTRRPKSGVPRVYFSAGIHGDEAAATEGLVTWAEEHPEDVASIDATILPCLNPWGLINNNRLNEDGLDLNRCYNGRKVPLVKAHLDWLGSETFDLALTLHEDYDAAGLYIYEVAVRRPFWAEELLASAARWVPPDFRKTIEGARARGGTVRRRLTPDLRPDWPEAFVLHFSHAKRTFTIETPSEFDLKARVRAQVAVIRRALELCHRE